MTVVLALKSRDSTGNVIGVNQARLLDASGTELLALSTRDWDGDASTSDTLGASLSALSGVPHVLEVTLTGRPPLPLAVELKSSLLRFRGGIPRCATLVDLRVTRGTASSRTVQTLTLTMDSRHREAIFVAGWDYSGGSDKGAYARTWRDDLYNGTTYVTGSQASLTRGVFDSTVVTQFDFKTGMRTRWLKTRAGWHELDEVLQGTVATFLGSYKVDANIERRHREDSISIVHCYDYIASLGTTSAGCLDHFHIFSHAWAGGPILINTFQEALYSTGTSSHLRDPGDKDGRIKDFNGHNPGSAAGFQAAFSSSAVVKIWGCFATTDYRRMIRAAALATSPAQTVSWRDYDGNLQSATAREVRNDIKANAIDSSYMAALSGACGVPVSGAPPGMGADLRQVGSRNYFYINTRTYRRSYDWYASVLGLRPDESGYLEFP